MECVCGMWFLCWLPLTASRVDPMAPLPQSKPFSSARMTPRHRLGPPINPFYCPALSTSHSPDLCHFVNQLAAGYRSRCPFYLYFIMPKCCFECHFKYRLFVSTLRKSYKTNVCREWIVRKLLDFCMVFDILDSKKLSFIALLKSNRWTTYWLRIDHNIFFILRYYCLFITWCVSILEYVFYELFSFPTFIWKGWKYLEIESHSSHLIEQPQRPTWQKISRAVNWVGGSCVVDSAPTSQMPRYHLKRDDRWGRGCSLTMPD